MSLEKETSLLYVCVCVCARACAVYFNINCTGRNLGEVFIKGKKRLFEVQPRRFSLCKVKRQ